MQTPWGPSHHVTVFAPGYGSVSTAGHGGFYLRPTFAERLSAEARALAIKDRDGTLWYEEDCDWMIPALETPEYWPAIFPYASDEIKADPRAYLVRNLSAWHAELLQAKGITPDPVGFAYWQKSQTRHRLATAKDPDLIVCARGDWHTHIPGIIEVITADDTPHLVTGDSYHRLQATGALLMLSACELYAPTLAEVR